MSSNTPIQNFSIKAEKLCKSYGRKTVLNQVDFSFGKGGIFGITGENGSGKTTLMNIAAGYLRADKGSVIVSGSQGYCPQETMVFMNLTIEDNINYFCRAYGIAQYSKGKPESHHMDEIIDQLGFS